MFEQIKNTELEPKSKKTVEVVGKDNRDWKTKITSWIKIVLLVYLLGLHLFTILYFTNSHLVLRIDAAPKVVSPLNQ